MTIDLVLILLIIWMWALGVWVSGKVRRLEEMVEDEELE